MEFNIIYVCMPCVCLIQEQNSPGKNLIARDSNSEEAD